jgi:hypothetical protein
MRPTDHNQRGQFLEEFGVGLTVLAVVFDLDHDEANFLLVEVSAAIQMWKNCIKTRLTVGT